IVIMLLTVVAAIPLGALGGVKWLSGAISTQAVSNVTGAYAGQVKLAGVFQGAYTDTTATPTTMDLGQIDLALNLSQTSNAVSGYIVLEQTLVYSQEHTITVTPVGPV